MCSDAPSGPVQDQCREAGPKTIAFVSVAAIIGIVIQLFIIKSFKTDLDQTGFTGDTQTARVSLVTLTTEMNGRY